MASAQQQTKNNLSRELVETWSKVLFDGRSLKVPVEDLAEWSLPHYLWAAVIHAASLDSEREEWQTPAWDFGRFAKAHPKLILLNENEALQEIKKSIGSQFWTEHFGMDVADAEMAFDDIWVECRAIPGYDPLRLAIHEAKRKSGQEDENAPAGYMLFVDMARSLQRLVAERAFLLPCHKLAPLLGCTPMTISRYRNKALRDGFLEVVKEHSYRSTGGRSEATEFRFRQGR